MAACANDCSTSGITISTISTPASVNFATAVSNALCGASRRSFIATVFKTPNRRPFNVVGVISIALRPSNTAKTCAASVTVFASGPTVSKRAHSGTTPVKLSLPDVVFKPTKSFQTDGIRTDPPVSEPIATGANPNATEAAAPDDEPPETASVSCTHGDVAVFGFSPKPENANSDICVFPKHTVPIAVAFFKTSASSDGTRFFNSKEPASVLIPAVSYKSFQLIGTPSSGDRRNPSRARSSASLASANARSWVSSE